jgi:hypothetical protein
MQKHNGIFSTENSFTSLGQLLGLEGTFTDKASLLSALDKLIETESKELTSAISRKLTQAGLTGVTKKITFAEDADGNIVIEGNISARQKRQLAKIINDDPELVERIKTQKARMEVAEELRKDGTKDTATGEPHKADLGDKKFDAARTQLLREALRESGVSLDDINCQESLRQISMSGQFFAIESELHAHVDRVNAPQASHTWAPGEAIRINEGSPAEKSTAVRSLLSMKRGELSEATDEERNFGLEMMQLRSTINRQIVDKYNDMYDGIMSDWQITGFSMEIDHNGKLKITDVQTWGNDPDANKQAERVMNTWLAGKVRDIEEGEEEADYARVSSMSEMARELGLAMLDAHDDEHGDVKEFKHKIVESGFYGYEILSPDADRAALMEIELLSREIGIALGDFFDKHMGIESPFAIIFGNDGMLSLDSGTLTHEQSAAVRQVLDELNDYLRAERAGEDTEGMLSPRLSGLAEKFLALSELQDKIHDKSLLPKDRFITTTSTV